MGQLLPTIPRMTTTTTNSSTTPSSSSAPPGTISCLFCSGIVSFKQATMAKFKSHLEAVHDIFFDAEFLLAVHFLREEERSRVLRSMRRRVREAVGVTVGPEEEEEQEEEEEEVTLMEEEEPKKKKPKISVEETLRRARDDVSKGPPQKMIKLTAVHYGFDEDVFPGGIAPQNTKSEPKTSETKRKYTEESNTDDSSRQMKKQRLLKKGLKKMKKDKVMKKRISNLVMATLEPNTLDVCKDASKEEEQDTKGDNVEEVDNSKLQEHWVANNQIVEKENENKPEEEPKKVMNDETYNEDPEKEVKSQTRECKCDNCGELFPSIQTLNVHKFQNSC